MTEALVSRAAGRSDSLNSRRKDLDGEKRKTKAQLSKLYDLVGSGELTMDATLSVHTNGLQDKVETLSRQIAHLDQERSAPVARLSDVAVGQFGQAVSAALRNPKNRAFAKAYIQTLVSKVSVSHDQIRISGPKDAVARQAAAFATKGELVPAFAQEWCTQQDLNL